MPTGGGPEFGTCGNCGQVHATAVCWKPTYNATCAAPMQWTTPVAVTSTWPATAPRISDEDVERIAKRVAELLKAP